MSRQSTEGLFLSRDQQDLLMAALNSNKSSNQQSKQIATPQNINFTPTMSAPGSGNLDFSDESPFLDFDPDADFDESFDFDENARMIGDIPGELHDKRKSIDGKDDDDEGGGKRREGEDKTAKKPGRKPLTSEPTSKRKAQNRAAQRAFRERKEKHLKDLEVKVEDLEKASESANHENGLLRAQVERLQVELKEYRKRLSWISSNGLNRSQPIVANPKQNNSAINNHNDFQFEFPKFGDLPSMPSTNLFGNSKPQKQQTTNSTRASSISTPRSASASQNSNGRRSTSSSQNQPARFGSLTQSPLSNGQSRSPKPQNMQKDQQGSVDSLSGLFSPSILEASRHASLGGYFPQTTYSAPGQNAPGNISGLYSNSSMSNSDSPSSSTESQNHISSIGTSPEPSLNSPANKVNDYSLNPINEGSQLTFGGKDLCDQLQLACGCADDPIPPILNMSNETSLGFNNNTTGFEANGINALAQQNNNNFDPVLFGDYRETQDNILSQDFGAFFNDAYPLPDLGSPLHNYTDITADQAPKTDLMQQVEAAKNEEVVPDTDRPMSCNKIWDRLQSMEKFRNGEIDIDNLCSELRAKAKCSEGGAVVDKKDVDKILGVV